MGLVVRDGDGDGVLAGVDGSRAIFGVVGHGKVAGIALGAGGAGVAGLRLAVIGAVLGGDAGDGHLRDTGDGAVALDCAAAGDDAIDGSVVDNRALIDQRCVFRDGQCHTLGNSQLRPLRDGQRSERRNADILRQGQAAGDLTCAVLQHGAVRDLSFRTDRTAAAFHPRAGERRAAVAADRVHVRRAGKTQQRVRRGDLPLFCKYSHILVRGSGHIRIFHGDVIFRPDDDAARRAGVQRAALHRHRAAPRINGIAALGRQGHIGIGHGDPSSCRDRAIRALSRCLCLDDSILQHDCLYRIEARTCAVRRGGGKLASGHGDPGLTHRAIVRPGGRHIGINQLQLTACVNARADISASADVQRAALNDKTALIAAAAAANGVVARIDFKGTSSLNHQGRQVGHNAEQSGCRCNGVLSLQYDDGPRRIPLQVLEKDAGQRIAGCSLVMNVQAVERQGVGLGVIAPARSLGGLDIAVFHDHRIAHRERRQRRGLHKRKRGSRDEAVFLIRGSGPDDMAGRAFPVRNIVDLRLFIQRIPLRQREGTVVDHQRRHGLPAVEGAGTLQRQAASLTENSHCVAAQTGHDVFALQLQRDILTFGHNSNAAIRIFAVRPGKAVQRQRAGFSIPGISLAGRRSAGEQHEHCCTLGYSCGSIGRLADVDRAVAGEVVPIRHRLRRQVQCAVYFDHAAAVPSTGNSKDSVARYKNRFAGKGPDGRTHRNMQLFCPQFAGAV